MLKKSDEAEFNIKCPSIVHPEMRCFFQDHLSGIAFRGRRKACEKINHPVEKRDKPAYI
jgi:hypothetical protein